MKNLKRRSLLRRLAVEQLDARRLLSAISLVPRVISEDEVIDSAFGGDIDSDGDTDIVFASKAGIGWYENLDGLGTFAAPKFISDTRGKILQLRMADLDGDGDEDVLYKGTVDFVWLENLDGKGRFDKRRVIDPTRPFPFSADRSLLVADVDGDSDIDVLADGYLYINVDGAGAFQAKKSVWGGGFDFSSNGHNTHVADMDGDNDLDIVSAGWDRIEWVENVDGSGQLDEVLCHVIAGSDGIFAVSVGDLDSDGDVDLLGARYVDDRRLELVLYENIDGKGHFNNGTLVPTFPEIALDTIHLFDMDGDGDVDVLTNHKGGNGIAWYENTDGKGTFSAPTKLTDYVGLAINVVDIDGDGDLDVLSWSVWGPGLGWYETAGAVPTSLSSQGFALHVVATDDDRGFSLAADMDSDGDPDIFVAQWVSPISAERRAKIVWYENDDGKGTFVERHDVAGDAIWFNSLSSADVDGDGDMDILSSEVHGLGSLTYMRVWYENLNGQGIFGPRNVISSSRDSNTLQSSSEWRSIQPADIDGDGDIDVVAHDLRGIFWHQNLDGRGNFSDAQLIVASDINIQDVQIADIDNDGDKDVLWVEWSSNRGGLWWVENKTGAKEFGEANQISALSRFSIQSGALRLADLDDDGDMDVFVSGYRDFFGRSVVWFENLDGKGAFGDLQLVARETGCNLADVNGDGHLDVLCSSRMRPYESIWYENVGGTGRFGTRQKLVGVSITPLFSVSDIDGDGDTDIVSTDYIGRDILIIWYENRLAGDANDDGEVAFEDFLRLSTNFGNLDAVWADGDFDGDGSVTFADFLILSSNFGNTRNQVDHVND